MEQRQAEAQGGRGDIYSAQKPLICKGNKESTKASPTTSSRTLDVRLKGPKSRKYFDVFVPIAVIRLRKVFVDFELVSCQL